MDTKQLDELLALHGRATQGEWFVRDNCIVDEQGRIVARSPLLSDNRAPGQRDDAECIVATNNWALDLISQAREAIALRALIPSGGCCNGSNPNCYGPRGCLVRAIESDRTPNDVLLSRAEKAKDEADMLLAENERLRKICDDAIGFLPVVPGQAPAYADHNIVPHVIAVADEHAVLREQVRVFNAENERLRAEVAELRKSDPEPDWMIWMCKIAAPRSMVTLEEGSDAPMRSAVRCAFAHVAGVEDWEIFSGWNGRFTPGERELVKRSRAPTPEVQR